MEEKKISIGGAAAMLGFDEGSGMQEFLARTKYKTKIDQVIDFYGVPYCYKNDINKFLKYRIQPRHYPIVHEHFYKVLQATGYGVDDFDYAKLQEDFNARQEKGPGLDIKIDIEKFKKENPVEQYKVEADVMQTMKAMMEEIQSLKQQFLSPKVADGKQPNTTGESKDGQAVESTGKEGTGTEGTTGATNKGINGESGENNTEGETIIQGQDIGNEDGRNNGEVATNGEVQGDLQLHPGTLQPTKDVQGPSSKKGRGKKQSGTV